MEFPGGVTYKVCPICKKQFSMLMSCGWAYTMNEKKFCSWSCMRKYERTRKKPNEKKEQVRELYHKGMRQYEIAKALYMSVQSVNYWLTKIKDEEMRV